MLGIIAKIVFDFTKYQFSNHAAMQKRHSNRKQYFDEQAYTTAKYVMPFIEEVMPLSSEISVLEIGCGEGGNLKPFLDQGCQKAVGVDLSSKKIGNAKRFFQPHPKRHSLKLICADIYDVSDIGAFDLVIARDVLEHIHHQDIFMEFVKKFLKPGGKLFLGFPPWHNPFGGHQQICCSRMLSRLPYLHLLPGIIYRKVLRVFGEKEQKIRELMEIKETGISIEGFESILQKRDYQTEKRTFYFINPNYEVKFNLKPRVQASLLGLIPYLRNFITTTNYYVVSLMLSR